MQLKNRIVITCISYRYYIWSLYMLKFNLVLYGKAQSETMIINEIIPE